MSGLSSPFHTGVAMDLVPQNEWLYTMSLASGITEADVGKAVELDTSAENQVKLATDGGTIFGQLQQVEDRDATGQLLGTIALKGIFEFTRSGSIAVGASIQGAGSGTVKSLTANAALNIAVESRDTTVVAYIK